MKAPAFWSGKDSLFSTLLSPLSWIYGLASWYRRMSVIPRKTSVPVICVGNIVAGGGGKTPTCLYLAGLLEHRKKKIFFLTRGYKSSLDGFRVKPYKHTAREAGDEALLLARTADTVVSRNRVAGAALAVSLGAQAIIMDDGYQNPSLAKDFNIVVFDGGYGIGNGHLLPAGPLRESLKSGLKRAGAVLICGPDEWNLRGRIKKLSPELPVFAARTVANGKDAEKLRHKKTVAFAGIARPAKFYDTLREAETDIIRTYDYADHHVFTESELEKMLAAAKEGDALLVTTAKDHVRLPPEWQKRVEVLNVSLKVEDENRLISLLDGVIA